MGEVVNSASNLCNKAHKGYDSKEIFVSNIIYSNLNKKNQELLSKNYNHDCYHGDIIRNDMEEWYQDNCIKKETNNIW